MPPIRWPITTIGLSSRVTVHMPSMAWKMTTASASTLMRQAPGSFRPMAASSGKPMAKHDNTNDQSCSPRIYSATPAAAKMAPTITA